MNIKTIESILKEETLNKKGVYHNGEYKPSSLRKSNINSILD
jgi:hypothetical protein